MRTFREWWRQSGSTVPTAVIPVGVRVVTEAVVLSLAHQDVFAATGAGEAAERLSTPIVQRLFHRVEELPHFETGPILVAPIPDQDMAPGYFVFALGVGAPRPGVWQAHPDEVCHVFPHYFSRVEAAVDFAQRVAPEPGAVDVLRRVTPQSAAHMAWSLWVDQRACNPGISDDWYLRESQYHVSHLAATGSDEAYLVWQRALTNVEPVYFVYDDTGTMSPTHHPCLFESRQKAQHQVEHMHGAALTWAAIDYVPDALRQQLQLDPDGKILRQSPPPVQIAVSQALPMGRPDVVRSVDGVDTHPAWYLSPITHAGTSLWVAWQSEPGAEVSKENGPARVRFAVDASDPQQVLAWTDPARGLRYFASAGIWCQLHPHLSPVEPARVLIAAPRVSLGSGVRL